MTNAPLSGKHWDDIYRNGADRWSLDNPNPEFVRLIESGEIEPRGSLCVIGSGRGFDAVFAAESGFSVTTIDISPSANSSARMLAKSRKKDIKFVEDDLLNISSNLEGSFDYIFEYVTFCAFQKQFLPKIIRNSFSLLKPGGKLISVLFPTDGRAGGPPFAIVPEKFLEITSEFAVLIRRENEIASVKPRKGNEILLILEKK